MNETVYKEYPHAPPHLFRAGASYMITGSVHRNQNLLDRPEKRAHFCRTLFERASLLGWRLEAWSVLPNHYHVIARAPDHSNSLADLIRSLHSITGRFINAFDGTPGRRVWSNYWDTCLTYERAYLARLHYVHTNPVRHGLVSRPEDYPFCSYQWFMESAVPRFRETVLSRPLDRLGIKDDF